MPTRSRLVPVHYNICHFTRTCVPYSKQHYLTSRCTCAVDFLIVGYTIKVSLFCVISVSACESCIVLVNLGLQRMFLFKTTEYPGAIERITTVLFERCQNCILTFTFGNTAECHLFQSDLTT